MTPTTPEVKDSPEEVKKQQQRHPEKKFSRQEQRAMARAEFEARQTLDNITSRFLDFFTEADEPEGQEVADKMTQLSAQWKTYCHKRGLKKEAHGLVENYCKGVLDQYLKAKQPAA